MSRRRVEVAERRSRSAWSLRGRSSLTGLELRPSGPRVVAFVVASVAAVLAMVAPTALAHSGKQSYLYISLFDDGVEGRVEIPVVDLDRVLRVDLADAPGGLRGGVRAAQAEIEVYVSGHFSLGDDTGTWSIEFGSAEVLATENGPYAVLPYVVDESFDGAPTRFTAEFDVVIESDPEKDALLIIEDDWRSATFDNGSDPLLGFSTGLTVQDVVLDDAGALSSMAAIRGLGSDAVRNGIDIMFVVAVLALGVVLLPAGRSRSDLATNVELLGRAARSAGVFGGLVAFGAAMAGLGVLDLPDRLVAVGVSVALGVLALAAIVARFRPGVRSAGPWLTAGAGFVVGLELGRVFVSDQLDRSRPAVSLVAFVVGAVIAMALVALFVGAPAFLVRRTRYATGVLVVVAAVLLGYSVAWTGERLLDADWPIEEFANPFRVWPRNAWFVLLAVAVAAGVRAIEARAGRLRPVGPDRVDDDTPVHDAVTVG